MLCNRLPLPLCQIVILLQCLQIRHCQSPSLLLRLGQQRCRLFATVVEILQLFLQFLAFGLIQPGLQEGLLGFKTRLDKPLPPSGGLGFKLPAGLDQPSGAALPVGNGLGLGEPGLLVGGGGLLQGSHHGGNPLRGFPCRRIQLTRLSKILRHRRLALLTEHLGADFFRLRLLPGPAGRLQFGLGGFKLAGQFLQNFLQRREILP